MNFEKAYRALIKEENLAALKAKIEAFDLYSPAIREAITSLEKHPFQTLLKLLWHSLTVWKIHSFRIPLVLLDRRIMNLLVEVNLGKWVNTKAK